MTSPRRPRAGTPRAASNDVVSPATEPTQPLEAPARPRPVSMISWVEGDVGASDDLTWDLEAYEAAPDALPEEDGGLLGAVVALGEHASIGEALPALVLLLARRCGCDIAAASFESAFGGGRRLVAAAREEGFDEALSAGLASLEGHELAGAITSALPGAVVGAWDLPVGARNVCTVWLARDAVAPTLDCELARAAGLALRAVMAGEALDVAGAIAESAQRRDRREVIVGRLTRAAAPSLAASHASLAAVQASLAAELAELRATAARHAPARAAAALLQEASGLAHDAWQVVSGVACLGDDASATCDASQVLQSASALAAPYLAPRAAVDVAPAPAPLVRVTPAALAEAAVVLMTRAAQRFVDAPGRVAVAVTAVSTGVEVEVRAVGAREPAGAREQDEAVADGFHRIFAERFGGAVEVVRDASGASRFRLTLPAA